MTDHVIHHGEGAQTLTLIPQDDHGRPTAPSSATYGISNLRHIEDAADRVVVASGTSATVDTTTATTDDTAGSGTEDPKVVPVDSTTGFVVSRHYLIQGVDGRREVFECLAIAAGDSLVANRELRHRYASGSTVRGIEVQATFPAATANDDLELDVRNPFAIDWVLTGVTPSRVRKMAWIQRHEPGIRATVRDIKRIDQTVEVYAGNRVDLGECLAAAHDDLDALLSIYPGGRSVAERHLGRVGKLYETWRALWFVYRQLGEQFEARTEDARRRSEFYETNLLSGQEPEGATSFSRHSDVSPDGSGRVYLPSFRRS